LYLINIININGNLKCIKVKIHLIIQHEQCFTIQYKSLNSLNIFLIVSNILINYYIEITLYLLLHYIAYVRSFFSTVGRILLFMGIFSLVECSCNFILSQIRLCRNSKLFGQYYHTDSLHSFQISCTLFLWPYGPSTQCISLRFIPKCSSNMLIILKYP
jgi:hypothetical protein